jgi:methionine-rich copper-binding protein CopC
MSKRSSHRFRQVVCLALIVTGVVLGAGPSAAAHTSLKGSNPKDGTSLSEAPDQIQLDFTEPIRTQLTRVSVRGPGDQRFEAGGAQSTATQVTQPLHPLGAAGKYEILFRVVALDGHPLVGTVRFTLTRPGPADAGNSPGGATPSPETAADGNSADGGGVSPWLLAVIAIAVLAFIAGAIWFGRSVTRDVD